MKKSSLIIATILYAWAAVEAQTLIPLWDQIPNRIESNEKEESNINGITRISKIQEPMLEVYLPNPRSRNGQAVIICPGGGYHILAYDWEGTDVAKKLNSEGITGIVLKYRVPKSESLIRNHEVPLMDAQRAVRLVRSRAEEWGLDEDRIGIMGFSAGGHLAATLATHFEASFQEKDPLDDISARPDFAILIYPVVTFQESYTHQGSRNALIGEDPSDEWITYFSNEKQVTATTPPTFLIHSADDKAVPVQNSLRFYEALVTHDVEVEMHLFPTGGHGYGLGLEQSHLHQWPDLLVRWLQQR